jgi:hypothetical protein
MLEISLSRIITLRHTSHLPLWFMPTRGKDTIGYQYTRARALLTVAVFEPALIYDKRYSSACYTAFSNTYGSKDFAKFMDKEVRKSLKQHCGHLATGRVGALKLHRVNLQAMGFPLKDAFSNATCYFCLLGGEPQHVLFCGHALCDGCVLLLATPTRGLPYHFTIHSCPLCDDRRIRYTRIKPPTSGVRVFSVDGGGTRGIIPLEYLKLMQGILGPQVDLQDYFDFAIGSSSGTHPTSNARLSANDRA